MIMERTFPSDVFMDRIMKLVKKRGMRKEDLHDILVCTDSSAENPLSSNSRWRSVQNNLKGNSVKAFAVRNAAKFFNVSADYLMGLKNDPQSYNDVFISDKTGLTQDNLDFLRGLTIDQQEVLKLLLMSNSGFINVLCQIARVRQTSEKREDLRSIWEGLQNARKDVSASDNQFAAGDLRGEEFMFNYLNPGSVNPETGKRDFKTVDAERAMYIQRASVALMDVIETIVPS